jgi:hypothetical protein
MEIQADLPKPALLLISDNYSPGWRAFPEPDSVQQKFRILPGDYILRAIPLEAGRQHFRLQYRPWIFILGKWVSILSTLLFIGILILHLSKPTIFQKKVIR